MFADDLVITSKVSVIAVFNKAMINRLFLKSTKYASTSLTPWLETGSAVDFDELPLDGTLDLQSFDGRCDLPDVVEGNTGKVAAPA